MITLIRKTAKDDSIPSTDKMRETILKAVIENGSPSDDELTALRSEVEDVFG